jgi:hypothetical protein
MEFVLFVLLPVVAVSLLMIYRDLRSRTKDEAVKEQGS